MLSSSSSSSSPAKPPSAQLESLVLEYCAPQSIATKSTKASHELEVRFHSGRKFNPRRSFTKTDYDRVVSRLKSLQFAATHPLGETLLRIQPEMTRHVRVEINGLEDVSMYCKTDALKPGMYDTIEKKKLGSVHFEDFDFSVVHSSETKKTAFVHREWASKEKYFRYMNRTSFKLESSIPLSDPRSVIRVDLTMVRSGSGKTIGASGVLLPTHTTHIEIEIELISIHNTPVSRDGREVLGTLRKFIAHVLGGIQGTLFPVSYKEQFSVLQEYAQLVVPKEADDGADKDKDKDAGKFPADAVRREKLPPFVGPSPVTLQLENVADPVNEEGKAVPNIRADFVVTDKADGERHLLYLSASGKVYAISSNMDVRFTGTTLPQDTPYKHSLLDGELITRGKVDNYLYLFAAFDLYFLKGSDVRTYPFTSSPRPVAAIELALSRSESEPESSSTASKYRYVMLQDLANALSSQMNTTTAPTMSPLEIRAKTFYPLPENRALSTIFDGCRECIAATNDLPYVTDGLVFTHATLGAGMDLADKVPPRKRVVWKQSFKWKPPASNTIDFLVANLTPVTDLAGGGGTAFMQATLMCGFHSKRDGYPHAYERTLKGEWTLDQSGDNYKPMQFFPMHPFDVSAGIAHLPMQGGGGTRVVADDGTVIENWTIVEFWYDIADPDKKKEHRWVPLRVRHDKTAKIRQGEKEFGNAYAVCNSNWRSIHFPVTEDMLSGTEPVPRAPAPSEDVYYNTSGSSAGKFSTQNLKTFHNVYVKRRLIRLVAPPPATASSSLSVSNTSCLIDFACGKGGDLSKWKEAAFGFVFGVDQSKDNIENMLDGACARYLQMKESSSAERTDLRALFVEGDSSLNMYDETAFRNNASAAMVAAAVLRGNVKDVAEKSLPKMVQEFRWRRGNGSSSSSSSSHRTFDVASCQFALHYFFRTESTLRTFVANVDAFTRPNGYFIATAYDGVRVMQLLKTQERAQAAEARPSEDGNSSNNRRVRFALKDEHDKSIWYVEKDWDSRETRASFEKAKTLQDCVGYRIRVFQESINQEISEYLVHYPVFIALMAEHGFTLVSDTELADLNRQRGGAFAKAHDSFEALYGAMQAGGNEEDAKAKPAMTMSAAEQTISFLNSYVIFKKTGSGKRMPYEKIPAAAALVPAALVPADAATADATRPIATNWYPLTVKVILKPSVKK